jgi:hypothetical protein
MQYLYYQLEILYTLSSILNSTLFTIKNIKIKIKLCYMFQLYLAILSMFILAFFDHVLYHYNVTCA